jgi:adenosyl cobinamide kinase/adenosyl cobinamide phosphate guanylyltransferase
VSLVVPLGGVRRGGSRVAAASAAPVVSVTTGEPGDTEIAAGVERHRGERPATWTTLEEPRRLLDRVAGAPAGSCLVAGCASSWAASLIGDTGRSGRGRGGRGARGGGGAAGADDRGLERGGLGGVAATPLGRAYRDVLGGVNQTRAATADDAMLVVAGPGLRLVDA